MIGNLALVVLIVNKLSEAMFWVLYFTWSVITCNLKDFRFYCCICSSIQTHLRIVVLVYRNDEVVIVNGSISRRLNYAIVMGSSLNFRMRFPLSLSIIRPHQNLLSLHPS